MPSKTLFSVMLFSPYLMFGALLSPQVEVFFGGSGNYPPHNLGSKIDLFSVSDTREFNGNPSFQMEAVASFGELKAYSYSEGTLPNGNGQARIAFARFTDQILISSANPTATYRWKPKVRVTGVVDWNSTGILTADTPPVALAMAQYTMLDSETAFTRYSHPDIIPDKGIFDQEITLQEIVVPANELFNYRFLLGVVTRVQTGTGFQITSATADFLHTLEFTNLEISDINGVPVDFTIQSGSGAQYSSKGIEAVPEPGVIATVLSGLVVLLFSKSVRRT